jgi:hypothetical protein
MLVLGEAGFAMERLLTPYPKKVSHMAGTEAAPPNHELHPQQTTSAFQCVALTVEVLRTFAVVPL